MDAERLPPLTLREVAEVLGMSRSEVDRTEQRALRKLRQHPLILELAAEFWPECDERGAPYGGPEA